MSPEAFAALQRALPQHRLSRLIGRAAASEQRWLSQLIIRRFSAHYGVDLSEAERPRPEQYASFNDFFTRALRADARPLAEDPHAVLCPADGAVSQLGTLDGDRLLQAKGTRYRLDGLAGRDLPQFAGGSFATIYLAPRDYHRVHLPVAGRLGRTTAIPGQLFSVNASTEAAVTDLFCRNERLVCEFDTALGPMLLVLVGALIVASIETVWPGPRSPYRRQETRDYDEAFDRGAEIGRFLLGSTVIVCFEAGRVSWDPALAAGSRVRMGAALGHAVGGPAQTGG